MTEHGGTDRATFFERITTALRRQGEVPSTPPADDRLVRLVAADADLLQTFSERARGAGMTVVHSTVAELGATVTGVLAERGLKQVTVEIDDDVLDAEVRTALEGRITDSSAPGIDMHFDADAGVSDVAAAIAETGTLVMAACPRRGRGVFIAPPHHVAIVRAAWILPDLLDWLRAASAEQGERSSATVLVTGPSKTADIEGILVTGVHGPGTVDIVVVTD